MTTNTTTVLVSPPSTLAVEDPCAPVIEALRGQRLNIPDLFAIYPDWKGKLHPNYEQVREEFEQWLVTWVPDEKRRKKQRKVDAALLSGYFYPDTPLERYRTLAEFFGWFFLWDDEIDCESLQYDREGTEQYRRNTITFLKYCFEPESCNGIRPVVGLHNSGCFESIGQKLQTGQSREALLRYADSMYDYVNSVCSHQEQRQIGLSTIAGYIARRTYTIGAYPCIFILEWAYGLDIPSWVYEHEATQVIMKETTQSNLLINDILSLKKEVAAGEVDSIIPVTMNERNVSAQEALDEVVATLEKSYEVFTAAERRLLETPGIDGKLREDVQMLIKGCKDITLGNVFWSYATERYLPRSCFYDGNKVSIVL